MLPRRQWHRSVTASRVIEMIEEYPDDNLGVCLACGEIADGVEPDARGYKCEACHRPHVYGAEEIVLMSV